MIRFTVYGVAQPKGSTRAFARMVQLPTGQVVARAKVTTDNASLKPWAECVRSEALDIAPKALLDGALRVEVRFFLPRPKSLARRYHFHRKKPDVDKLLRGALDPLSGVIWRDDSQVFYVAGTKQYARADERPRAEFEIEEWGV